MGFYVPQTVVQHVTEDLDARACLMVAFFFRFRTHVDYGYVDANRMRFLVCLFHHSLINSFYLPCLQFLEIMR